MINRHFQVRTTDARRQRWLLDSTDDAAYDSHVQIACQISQPASFDGILEVAAIRCTAAAGTPRSLRIEGPDGSWAIEARGVYVHETPGPRYRDVLPPVRVPWLQRLSWRVLLATLRVPGAFALVMLVRRRGARRTGR
jgi:hypothetical protein